MRSRTAAIDLIRADTSASWWSASLALGPPSGDLTPFLAKVRTLQAKHTFSFAVVLGDFFGPPSAGEDEQWEDLLGGRINGQYCLRLLVGLA